MAHTDQALLRSVIKKWQTPVLNQIDDLFSGRRERLYAEEDRTSNMMEKVKNKKPVRQRFSEYEKKYKWLPMLLDAYHINDIGVYKEAKIERKMRKQKIACRKGRHNCCLRYDVPISGIEISGISWFVSEMISDKNLRLKLKSQLMNHNNRFSCPFLVENTCSLYPMRPIACREFHVFGDSCKKGENTVVTRPHDVWSPSRNVGRKKALKILPYYGFYKEADKIRVYEEGFIHRNSIPMHLFDWVAVVDNMNMAENSL